MLVSSLHTFAKKEDEAAYEKGTITAIASIGFPNLNKVYEHDRSAGPFSAAVDYQLSGRFGISLLYAYKNSVAELKTVETPARTHFANGTQTTIPAAIFQYRGSLSIQAIMATGEYCYRNKGKVRLSSGLGFGLAIWKHSAYFSDGIDHSGDPNFRTFNQFTYRIRFLDVKVKLTKDLGVNGGIGFGYDGIFNAGLHYTIGRRS